MNKVRERNIGWRIDYFIASKRLEPALENADIHPDILGSDHCPIVLEIDSTVIGKGEMNDGEYKSKNHYISNVRGKS